MQLTSAILSFFLMSLLSTSFATESSTDVRLTPNTQKIYRCYGTSDPTTQESSSLTYTDWWRCDGVNVTNEYITCPSGYVAVGVYTWKFTDSSGWVSRCRTACSEVTAYSPPSNCRWE